MTRTYPDCPPVGFRLRAAYQARRFRIHSLPAAKRYAENESEYQEILRRQNAVLTDTLGNDQPFVLVSAGYSEAPAPAEMWPAVAAHDTITGLAQHLGVLSPFASKRAMP